MAITIIVVSKVFVSIRLYEPAQMYHRHVGKWRPNSDMLEKYHRPSRCGRAYYWSIINISMSYPSLIIINLNRAAIEVSLHARFCRYEILCSRNRYIFILFHGRMAPLKIAFEIFSMINRREARNHGIIGNEWRYYSLLFHLFIGHIFIRIKG